MPVYKVKDKTFDIPEEKASRFESKYPDAVVDIYDAESGKQYGIPVSKVAGFKKKFPRWSYYAPSPDPERGENASTINSQPSTSVAEPSGSKAQLLPPSADQRPSTKDQPWQPSPAQKAEMAKTLEDADRTIAGMHEAAAQTGRIAASMTQHGRDRSKALRQTARQMGIETDPAGLLNPQPSSNLDSGGSEATAHQRPKTNDQRPIQNSKSKIQNSTQGAQFYGLTRDSEGNIIPQWQMPDGSITTSFSEADRSVSAARQERNRLDNLTIAGQLRRERKRLEELQRRQQEKRYAAGKEATENGVPYNPYARSAFNAVASDPEADALGVAIRQSEERIKKLERQKDQEQGKDVGFWRGFGDVVSDFRTWDLGMSDMKDALVQKKTSDKIEKGEQLNESERRMMQRLSDNQGTGDVDNFWNRAGVMTAEMIPFMLDFAMMGGASSGSSAISRGLTAYMMKGTHKVLPKVARNKVAQWSVKVLGTMPEDLVRAGVMTNTVQGMKTGSDIIGRKLGDVVQNEDGSYRFENDKDWGSAVWQSEANNIIENYSEMFGTHLEGVLSLKNAAKIADTFGAKRLSGILSKASASELAGIAGTVQKQLTRLGVSDYVGEVGEEYYGQLWRSMLNLDDAYKQNPDGSRTNLFLDSQFHGDIWGGMALSMGLMGAGKYTLSAAAYGAMKHRVNKADARASEILTPEIWDSWRQRIDSTPNADVKDTAISILGDPDLSDDQKKAAMTYMERSLNLRGFNLGSVARQRDAEVNEDEATVNQSYMDGYSAEEPEEMNRTKLLMEQTRERFVNSSSEDFVAEHFDSPDAVSNLLKLGNDEDLRQTALDYLNARAAYDGMLQHVRDDIDGQISQSDAQIQSRVNRSSGSIQPAVIKDADADRPVFIIDGDIQISDDGTVDHEKSHDSIIVRDAETGKLEFKTPADFLSVAPPLDPEAEMETARQQIRHQVARNAADAIDGVLSLNPGDRYTVPNVDGIPEEIEILGQSSDENGVPIPDTFDIQYPDGSIVYNYSADAIRAAVEEINNRAVAAFRKEQSAPASPLQSSENGDPATENVVPSTETIQPATETIQPATENQIQNSTSQIQNSEETVPNGDISTEESRVAELSGSKAQLLPTSDSQVSQTIPLDQNGDPDYDRAEPDTAWDALVRQTEGDEDIARSVIEQTVSEKEADLKKLQKQKPKAGLSIKEKIQAEKDKKRALDAMQRSINHWKAMGETSLRRQQAAEAEQRRIEAKRLQEEARIEAERVAEQQRIEAERKEREKAEREEVAALKKIDRSYADVHAEVKEYPEAVERLHQQLPEDILEAAALVLSTNKLLWGDNAGSKGTAAETGFREGERKGLFSMFASGEKGGKSLARLAEDEMKQVCDTHGIPYENSAARDALIEIISQARIPSDITRFIRRRRIDQARQIAEGEARREREAFEEWSQENYHMSADDFEAYEENRLQEIAFLDENFDANEYYGNIADELINYNLNRNETIHTGATQSNDSQGESDDIRGGDQILSPQQPHSSQGSQENAGGSRIPQKDGSDILHSSGTLVQDPSRAESSITQQPTLPPLSSKIAEAEAQVNTDPSDAQKEADNYKKGHVQVGAFDVTIENPKGSVRRGVDADGKKWETTMTHTYGYIRGTTGVDGDHIDVYISSDVDDWDGRKAFVVDQYNPDGSFDEHKVMLGFNDRDDAFSAYLSNYEDGWRNGRRLDVSAVNLEDFEKWIDSSKRKTKPFAEYKSVKTADNNPAPIGKGVFGNIYNQFKGKVREAISFLRDKREGEAVGALNHHSVGEVSIVWGNKKAGLEKILIKHPEVADNLQEIIDAMEVVQESDNRIKLESPSHFAVISKEWMGQPRDKWLLTAYEKKEKSASDGSMDIVNEPDGLQNDTAPLQNGLSDNKVNTLSSEKQTDTKESSDLYSIQPKPYTNRQGKTLDTYPDNAPLSLSDLQLPSPSSDQQPTTTDQRPSTTNQSSKWVDEEDAEEFERLRSILRNGLGQLNSGFPPELLYAGGKMSYLIMKHGVRKFADYASAMIEELGEAIRPHLKSLYNFTRSTEEVMESEWAEELTPFDEVMKFDTANFGKNHVDAIATAENIVAEEASQRHLSEAEKKLKEQRNVRLNPDGSTTETINEGGDFIPGVYPPIDDKPKKKQGKKKDPMPKQSENKPTASQLDLFGEEEQQIINDVITETAMPEPKPDAKLSGDSAAYQDRTRQERDLVEDIIVEIMKRADMKVGGEDRGSLTMRDIKGMLENYNTLTDISATDLQELVERAMTILTRKTAKAWQADPRKGYDRVVAYYNMQPMLNARDSERLIKQQYSTPTPFGYVMGQFVNAKSDVKSILEPSAGNGALTIMFDPATVHVNDIDERRLENLRTLGYSKVTAQNGLLPFDGEKVDGVLTNPPFGTVAEKIYDNIFKISSLEGQMAINALDSMKDGGRAAIIIGGNTSYRTNGSMNTKDAAFFGYLYSHYNVADVINISGKSLYARNGTGYDVRMILIDGRKTGEFSRVYPPVKSKARAEQVTTFDDLYKRVQDDIQQVFQMGHKPTDEQHGIGRSSDGRTGSPIRGGNDRKDDRTGERPISAGKDERGASRMERTQHSESGDGGGYGSGIEQEESPGVDNGYGRDGTGNNDVPRRESGASGHGEPHTGVDNGRRGSGRDGRVEATSRPDVSRKRLAVKTGLGDEKVPYPNQSGNGFTLLSVVPAAQADVLQRSLGEIGDVDQFLVKELGYSSKDELYGYLAAEQIDSVALAIHQMNKGNAFIIGDMTGVGKGRQGAALIRYAVKHGKCPIYFTQKPTLFTDNYRDLSDIGSGELRPFIIASDDKEHTAYIRDFNGNVIHKLPTKKERERVYDYILKHGTLPKEYDYVITTYSQIQNDNLDYKATDEGWITEPKKYAKGKSETAGDRTGQKRRDILAKLASGSLGKGNIVILDESHTVGGDSGSGRYMQMLTSKAYGVSFMSATFAKRADNMPIYAQRTAISEAGIKADELIAAIAKGGVTLQEIMSKQLVESGQMIRRERSFEGVTIDWLSVDDKTDRKQREQFNEVADIFNSIRNFQNDFIKPIIDGMNEDAAEQGATVGQTQGTKDLGVRNTPFASKMYNLVNQLLFALKVDAVADRVIENLRNGFKPVISFTNTMEGFLASAPKGVAMDEVPNFSLTLMRALEGVMRFTENDADQNSEGGRITVGQLSPEGQAAYNAVKDKIMNLSADLPISPMDAIRMKIEEAGYNVAEITGRTTQLNRTEDGRYIVEERRDKDAGKNMRDFNSGKLDVLMINKSGSTGISLHASSKFKDQRQRVMVFAQFQSDINDEVQMRGRIDRSGQVVRGRYEYIMSSIPAEQRIQMMFKAKLKSLDANTTSSQKSKFNEIEIVDYLNKYGDEVVWEYMKEHPELSDRLGDPLEMLQDKKGDDGPRNSDKEDTSKKPDCAGKISRYLAFLSVDEQDEIFREITEAYKVKIQLLDDAGENDLEITTMPLKAESKSKQIWHSGENPGSGNAFADNTYVEEVEVDVLKKPMKRTEIEEMTRKLMGDKVATATEYDQMRYGMKEGDLNWNRYADTMISEIDKFFSAKVDDALEKMKESGANRVSKAREKAVKDALRARGKGENTFSDQEIEALADAVAKEAQDKEDMKQLKRQNEINAVRDHIKHLLSRLRAGHIYVVPQDLKQATADMFTQTFGTFVGFKFNKSYTLGSSTAIFATLDGRRKVELALNDKAIETIIRCTDTALRYSPREINAISMDNWDSKVPTQTRQKRYIITGNLLQALVDTEKGERTRGNLISFSTKDGNTRQGILMSENFKPTDLRSSVPLRSRLKQIQEGKTVVSENGDVQIERISVGWEHRGDFELIVPKSKQRGGIYTMNAELLRLVEGHNFVSKGNRMVGYILPENLAKVVDMLSHAPFNLTVLEESKLSEVNDEDENIRFRSDDDIDITESVENVSDLIEIIFNDAVAGNLKGKPVEIGKLTDDGKKYLEKLSGSKFKENISFVLNPSDLMHIYKRHFGNNEKDGRNIPLTIEDLKEMGNIISNPDRVLFAKEKNGQQRHMFFFLKEAKDGSYNLMEIYSDKKGNLTAKSFFKSKEGVSQRAMLLNESSTLTSVTDGATRFYNANLPIFFDSSSIPDQNYISSPQKSQNNENGEENQRRISSRTSEENIGDIQKRQGSGRVSESPEQQLTRPGRGPWELDFGEAAAISKKNRQFIERSRKHMRNTANRLSKSLGIHVNAIEDPSPLSGKKKSSKGWFDTLSGEISIVIPNHRSSLDVEKTILHEAVAHYGLRRLFADRFDDFLDRVYEQTEPRIKEQIALLASRNGWNRRVATEEYLASLAEETNFEDRMASWWGKIKQFFLEFLRGCGFDVNLQITDNELRYVLWISYKNLRQPGSFRSFLGLAEKISMQHRLGLLDSSADLDRDETVGTRYIASTGASRSSATASPSGLDRGGSEATTAAEANTLFRSPDYVAYDRKIVADHYERMVASGSFQFREAVQDSMLGLRALYKAVLGDDTNMEDIPAFQNAYIYENRMSSANKGEQEEYFTRFMRPLLNEIHSLCGTDGLKRRLLSDYLIAKHGLERNEKMREAAEAAGENTDRDFAGLCGLTGKDDWQEAEMEAQAIVDAFESLYPVDDLWDKINAATKASLEKLFLSGVISEDTYLKVRDMYEYYVPLRGFDETTSDEVYGYLSSDSSHRGSVMKSAEGRSSKADDPVAFIARMADSSIQEGNRNIMKQRFLNFVLNNPSDLVSVSNLWLEYDPAKDEWKPLFAPLTPDMSPAQVKSEVDKFEAKMEALATAEPDRYKKGHDKVNIPYRVLNGDLAEHQILVKRNGKPFVLTINGNPRAAQALNGLTNPNVEMGGAVGNMLRAGEFVNRQLSAFYTTRNPDFVVSNFLRDAVYSNCMTWVRESPRYALRFHRNFGRFNPVMMRRLLGKWQSGSLDESDTVESMFRQFMRSGGETGYTDVRDIEGHKKAIAREMKNLDRRNVGRKAWNALSMQLDLLNRSVENCARFAAFVTSREMGRSLDRAVLDAKEISVNFNKKGSGGKMVNAVGQTLLGKTGGYIGGSGRLLFVFWNAGLQGLTNFGRAARRHPGKFAAVASSLFSLGVVIPLLAQLMGGGDDDDRNSYYNLPEYVRRSNVCFRAGGQWVVIPLPIEYRSIYGLGELATGVISGNERYSDSELAFQMASQVSQVLPLDLLEGGGGVSPFIPSSVKPFTEAYIMNKGWTGLPVANQSPFNELDPEWKRVYQSADQHIVQFSRWLNEVSGGSDYRKGKIDLNPAKIEYMLSGTFGGMVSFPMKVKKGLIETPFGDREFEWKNIPLANRVVKSGDERTANRKLIAEYFKFKNEAETVEHEFNSYRKDAAKGVLEAARRANFIYNSPEFLRYQIFEALDSDLDAMRKAIKQEADAQKKKEMSLTYYLYMRRLVNALNNPKQYLNEVALQN